MKMNNFLVTGCAGFIGSHAVDLLLSHGHKVCGVDKLTYAGNIDNLDTSLANENFTFYQSDICDRSYIEKLINTYKTDCIINFAAESHVDNSIKGSDSFIFSNIIGVKELLEICKNRDIKFCQISTDEVYGSITTGSFSESDVLSPKNYYSATKAAAEHIVTAYHNTFNIDYLIVRMSNNYGPRQHSEKFLPTIVNSINNNKRIPLYGKGDNIRDWIYVKDSVRIIYNLILRARYNDIYNISFNDERKNIDVIRAVLEYLNLDFDSSVEFVDDRLGHDFRYSIDNNKMSSLVRFEPTSFQDGLEQTIDFYNKRYE
tara:strand:- start:192 stop:1136 length:945 start_codon:yes stop_codon:yes gene_type:complete